MADLKKQVTVPLTATQVDVSGIYNDSGVARHIEILSMIVSLPAAYYAIANTGILSVRVLLTSDPTQSAGLAANAGHGRMVGKTTGEHVVVGANFHVHPIDGVGQLRADPVIAKRHVQLRVSTTAEVVALGVSLAVHIIYRDVQLSDDTDAYYRSRYG